MSLRTASNVANAVSTAVTAVLSRALAWRAAAAADEPALADVPPDYRDPTPFAFQKGDVVAILGPQLGQDHVHAGAFLVR